MPALSIDVQIRVIQLINSMAINKLLACSGDLTVATPGSYMTATFTPGRIRTAAPLERRCLREGRSVGRARLALRAGTYRCYHAAA